MINNKNDRMSGKPAIFITPCPCRPWCGCHALYKGLRLLLIEPLSAMQDAARTYIAMVEAGKRTATSRWTIRKHKSGIITVGCQNFSPSEANAILKALDFPIPRRAPVKTRKNKIGRK